MKYCDQYIQKKKETDSGTEEVAKVVVFLTLLENMKHNSNGLQKQLLFLK